MRHFKFTIMGMALATLITSCNTKKESAKRMVSNKKIAQR